MQLLLALAFTELSLLTERQELAVIDSRLIDFINGYICHHRTFLSPSQWWRFFFAGIIKGFWVLDYQRGNGLFDIGDGSNHCISLLTLPIIFTNIMQYTRCENPRPIARKYWIFALAIVLSIFITSFFILSYPKALLTTSIGLAMIAFSLTQMFGTKFPIGDGYGFILCRFVFRRFGRFKFNMVASGCNVFTGP